MEYHANGRWWCVTACDVRQALCDSVKLIFEGSWALLLNNNSRELVSITSRSGCK